MNETAEEEEENRRRTEWKGWKVRNFMKNLFTSPNGSFVCFRVKEVLSVDFFLTYSICVKKFTFTCVISFDECEKYAFFLSFIVFFHFHSENVLFFNKNVFVLNEYARRFFLYHFDPCKMCIVCRQCLVDIEVSWRLPQEHKSFLTHSSRITFVRIKVKTNYNN